MYRQQQQHNSSGIATAAAHLHSDGLIKGCLDVLHAVTDLGAHSMIQHKLIGNKLGEAPLDCALTHWDALFGRWANGSLQQVQPFQKGPIDDALHGESMKLSTASELACNYQKLPPDSPPSHGNILCQALGHWQPSIGQMQQQGPFGDTLRLQPRAAKNRTKALGTDVQLLQLYVSSPSKKRILSKTTRQRHQ